MIQTSHSVPVTLRANGLRNIYCRTSHDRPTYTPSSCAWDRSPVTGLGTGMRGSGSLRSSSRPYSSAAFPISKEYAAHIFSCQVAKIVY